MKTEKEPKGELTNNPISAIEFKTAKGNYEYLFAIQIPVIRGKDKKILTDDDGQNIRLKLNVVSVNGKFVRYQYIGNTEETVAKLIKDGKLSNDLRELKPIVDFLFVDRYCTDGNIRKKINDESLLTSRQMDALSVYVNDENNNYYYFKNKLIELGYTVEEIEQIIATYTAGRTNTYVGVKDVELTVTNEYLEEGKIEREIMRLKRAGINKVILLKNKYISSDTLYKTMIKIKAAGLQPIMGITKDILDVSEDKKSTIYDFIEKSSRSKSLTGFRFMFDIDNKDVNLLQEKLVKGKDSILELIKKSGKEISYKPSTFNEKEMTLTDDLFEGKVIFVVKAKNFIKNNNQIEITEKDKRFLSSLADKGKLSLYFDKDIDNNLDMAKMLVEKIFGKGLASAKTMISLGTTYTANMFAELFKKNVMTEGFCNAYEIGYKPIFGNISPDIVAGAFKNVLRDNMTFDKFLIYVKEEKLKTESKYKEVFTKEFEDLVISQSIKENGALKPEEQTAMLRQYIIGFLVSYIENNFDEFYTIKLDEDIDIKKMNINTKNQIVYRILFLLLNDMDPDKIKKSLTDVGAVNNENKETMEKLVYDTKNNDISKYISQQMAKSDSKIMSLEDIAGYSQAVTDKEKEDFKMAMMLTIFNDINILLEDSLLPIATDEAQLLGDSRAIKNILKKS